MDNSITGEKSDSKIKIAVCYYYPEDKYIENQYCIPVQVGYDETGIDMGIQKDNTGDNRSHKHPIYSEYSGIYWLWKNTEADYKGMFHHRRFLSAKPLSFKRKLIHLSGVFLKRIMNIFYYKPFSWQARIICKNDKDFLDNVDYFLSKLPVYLDYGYDIIVPEHWHYYYNNVESSRYYDVDKNLVSIVKLIISETFPEYYECFEKLLKGQDFFYSNCCVMKDSIFNNYCYFAFTVFDELEKQLIKGGYYIEPLSEKALYRAFGYIGELLMSSYIKNFIDNGGRVKELPVLINASSKGYKRNYILNQ